MSAPPLFLIINTHTERHLATVLGSLAWQRHPIRAVCVTVDGNPSAIREVVRETSRLLEPEVVYVAREHQGIMRAAQSRNNSIRALQETNFLSDDQRDAVLVYLDGDIVLSPTTLDLHAQTTKRGTLTISDRINLSEEDTKTFTSASAKPYELLSQFDVEDELARLEKGYRRARRHRLLRRFHLTKNSKPKLISAHFSVSYHDLLSINGFDEEYEGYGAEDDDLAARLYMKKVYPQLGTVSHRAYHLWHPTQAQRKWNENPGVKRFLHKRSHHFPAFSEHGLNHSYPDNPFKVERFKAGSLTGSA